MIRSEANQLAISITLIAELSSETTPQRYDKSVFIIASLDEMFITALLDRQTKAVVAEACPGVFIHSLT